MSSSSVNRFGTYLRTKWVSPRRIRFWLLVLVIVYTLVGFFALPWVIQSVAENTAKDELGRELRIESVQTNPYTLTVRINGVELKDTDDQPLLSWGHLFVDLAWSSITNQAWTLETIQLDQPVIREERFASGETRFSRLAAEFGEESNPDAESAQLPALQINQLRVEDGVIRFADEPVDTVLELQKIDLAVDDFTLQPDTSFPVRLDGQLKDGGELALDGKLQVLPTVALTANASMNELALKQAEPYLQQFVNVQLNSGTLTLSGELQTDTQQPFAFQGSAGISSLSIKEGSTDESLIGWQNLQTEQLELNLNEKQITTKPIIIEGLSGRVVIFEDKTTNFGQLVIKSSDEESIKEDDGESDESEPFDVAIESIELADGALEFSDNSLPLPFSTNIHTLNGEVSTLSSTSAEPARVELEGEVAEFGLAHVKGRIQAWNPMRETKLNLKFRNLQIPEYSPYTVEFAGRKIAEGVMDLDLDYTIQDNQLDGENNIVLHDLKLGEKMESGDAMDLPLNLAIALLKDSDGVIDLALPVTGDVDDPQFDISEVIQQALGDAIKSVVTAPFSFLANLVGADSEELGQIEFAPGRTDLRPQQRQRIAKLREALNERPDLILELAGPFSETFDGPVMKKAKAIDVLKQRLADEGLEAESPSLTSESNQALVEAMFTKLYPDTELDTVKSRFTEEEELDALAYRNHLADKVIAAQSVSTSELKEIASARAQAVQDALVNNDGESGIAAERVSLLDPKEVDSGDDERIAMELGISSGP